MRRETGKHTKVVLGELFLHGSCMMPPFSELLVSSYTPALEQRELHFHRGYPS